MKIPLPHNVQAAIRTSVGVMLAGLGTPQEQIDAALGALFDELGGRGVRSITNGEPLDRVLSPKQTAELLGKSTKTVRDLAKRGKIRAVRCGAGGCRASGYTEGSIRKFIAGLTEAEAEGGAE